MMDELVTVTIGEPEVEPRSSVGMSEIEFAQHLLDHASGRRRWPVVVTVPVDLTVWPGGLRAV